MRVMTDRFLRDAFAGESQASMKYILFALKAEEENLLNIARLFKAISHAELIHARNHLKALKALNKTSKNLEAAIAGETYEVNEMYPAYIEVAKLQGEKRAEQSVRYALEAEKIHASMYQRAKKAVESGKDIELKNIYICNVCGYTVEGEEAPEKCPICGAPRKKFKKF